MNNIAKEVFEEVMEHEMALAGLININLEEMLPMPDTSEQMKARTGLLRRMTSVQ